VHLVASLPTVPIGASGIAVVDVFLPMQVNQSDYGGMQLIVTVDGVTFESIPQTLNYTQSIEGIWPTNLSWAGVVSGLSPGNHSFSISIQNLTGGVFNTGVVPTSPVARLIVQPK
jgi:hypothetical protein